MRAQDKLRILELELEVLKLKKNKSNVIYKVRSERAIERDIMRDVGSWALEGYTIKGRY